MERILTLTVTAALVCLLVTGLVRLVEAEQEGECRGVPGNVSAPAADTTFLPEPVDLPAPIPGTSLVVEGVVCYEGAMLEDRSDAPVGPALALILRNTGENVISRAEVILERGGECCRFYATWLLPGMRVLVVESAAADYFTDGITALSGWEETASPRENLLDGLELTHRDMTWIHVRNTTDAHMENIRLYHKHYLSEGLYLGGITYETIIPSLLPGQTVSIFPEHYAQGYSQIFYAQ